MNLIKNLSFRKKLLALIAPPILGTILFSGLNLNNAIHEKSVVDQITPLVELSISSSLIVHELQKERGATAGFVGSKGKSFKDTLAKQRQDTNVVLNREVKLIQEIGNSIKTEQPQVYSDLNRVITIIDSLSKLRSQVDLLALSAPNSAKFYTDLNAAMLSLSGSIANISTQGELTTKLRNYYTFMQAKEAAGQERAILNIALSHGAFPVGIYQKVVTLNAYQNAYLKTFEQFATKEQITNLNKIHSSSDGVRVEEIRQIANKKYIEGNFGVTGQEWFTVSTNRINLMKDLEDQLAGNIHDVVSSLENKANNAIYFSSILILFILLLTFALTIIISKLLIGQALQLTKTIDDVSQARDLSLRARIQSTDELGTGAKSFNDMLTGFGNMLSNIEANSIQLATAAEQTSVSISENAKSLEKQSHETAQAAASTEEMTATVNEIAQSTVMTAESANHAALLSTEGVTAVESNAHNMSKLNEQISDANVQVVKLRNSSKEISEIVDVIKSIADQTNLLALNAAIEAARAGESGRGFAVVADEVRTLAQRTQESTQKIEDMVGRFQSEADGVSKSIESSFTHVKASREQTISVKDKLTEINNAIESIKDMSNQVATAAEEQVAATSEIAKNIRTISDLAEEGANTGEQISKAAQEQTELCSQQHDLVAMFTLKR